MEFRKVISKLPAYKRRYVSNVLKTNFGLWCESIRPNPPAIYFTAVFNIRSPALNLTNVSSFNKHGIASNTVFWHMLALPATLFT